MIDKRHTLLLSTGDPNAVVALYAAWFGNLALLGQTVGEFALVDAPTRVAIPLRRNFSLSRLQAAEDTLLGVHALPLGEAFLVWLTQPAGTRVGLFAVPRGVEIDVRVESLPSCDEERARRMPPRG